MKIEQISKRILFVLMGIIIVCFVLFGTIGFNNPVGDYNEPKLMDLIMWLMYIMLFVTFLCACWSMVRSIKNSKGGDSANTKGVPGAKVAMGSLILLVVSLGVGILFGLGETDFTAADGTVTSAGWVTVVDMFCISIAIMLLVAMVAVGVSMTGVLTKSASK